MQNRLTASLYDYLLIATWTSLASCGPYKPLYKKGDRRDAASPGARGSPAAVASRVARSPRAESHVERTPLRDGARSVPPGLASRLARASAAPTAGFAALGAAAPTRARRHARAFAAVAPAPPPLATMTAHAVAEGDGGIAGKLYAVALGSRQAAAGGLAGIIARTASAPLDRVKLLFQVQAMEGAGVSSTAYTGVGQAFAKIYREEGILAFWRGNGVNVIRVAPYAAAQLSSNDLYKKMLTPEGGSLGLKERLAAGAAAGMTGTALTHPLDTIRLRLALPNHGYKGIGDAFVTVARHEGVGALYKGLVPTLAGIAPYAAINFRVVRRREEALLRRERQAGPDLEPLRGRRERDVQRDGVLPAGHDQEADADEGEDVQRHGGRVRDHLEERGDEGVLQGVDRQHAQGGPAKLHPVRELRGAQEPLRRCHHAHLREGRTDERRAMMSL